MAISTLSRIPEASDKPKERSAPLRILYSWASILGSSMSGRSPSRLLSFSQLSLNRRWMSMIMTIVSLFSIVGCSSLLLLQRSMLAMVRQDPLSTSSTWNVGPSVLPEYLQAQTYLAGPPTTNFRGMILGHEFRDDPR